MSKRVVATRMVPEDQSWFFHPEMQDRIAQAEEDLREGRLTRTEDPEEAQTLLDELKRMRSMDETKQTWAEEAERRYQEICGENVEVQDSDEVFNEARFRQK